LDASIHLHDLYFGYFRNIGNNALGQREALREIVQVSRCCHHHRLRGAVVNQRHRHLDRQRAGLPPPCARPEGEPRMPARRVHYSAAGRMRRARSACASYSTCHSDGPFEGLTCTAVTLYSGQFVAQSEKSVVTTFACVVGWWKVV